MPVASSAHLFCRLLASRRRESHRWVRRSVSRLRLPSSRSLLSPRSTTSVVQTLYLSGGCRLLFPKKVFQHPCGIAATSRFVRDEVQYSEDDAMSCITCPDRHLSCLEHV